MVSISKSKHKHNLTNHLENNAYVNELYEQSNLTRLQVLYWLGQSLRKDSQIFNTIYSYTIYNEVDQSYFERSFQSLVHQSDAFRAVIVKENGFPQLSFLNYVPKELKYVDFSGEKNPEAEYELWLLEQSGAILDLSICSYDSALIKINDNQYIWYLNQHHMLVDANSFSVIFRRLARLYERLMVGEDLILEGTPNFQDYVAYERKYRQSPQYERAKVYWDEKINNPPEEMLFFGRAPRKKTTKVIRRSTNLGQDRSSFLRNFTQQEGIFTINEELSLFNLFAGMFFILLHQLSGNRRLGFVTPVHNRFNEQFRDTIGLLIEFSPIQIELAGEDTLESIIKKVKQETRETMAYYQYGSGIMAQKSGFDVIFNTYRVPEMTLDNGKVLVKRIHPGQGTESLALHVTDVEYSQSIELHFDFHEDVFNPEQQEKIIEGYVNLLDKLIIDSNQQIDEINVFAPKRE